MLSTLDIVAEFDRRDANKPYVELIDGIEVPKASPMTRHGLLQFSFAKLLDAWCSRRGIVGTEIRVWLQIGGDRPTTLVPDVAFVSIERFAPLSEYDRERMPFAPDLAVEIRSPSDRARNLARKIELYLAHGARLVLDVNPKKKTIAAHDGERVRTFARGETFAHDALSGLTFDVTAFFESGEMTTASV